MQNNYIGTDVTGEIALSINDGDGVHIDGAPDNVVAHNLISGNMGGTGNGLTIVDAGANGNVVTGNIIGLGAGKDADLGNAAAGVAIGAGALDNVIGGTSAGDGNIISGNSTDGILITDAATSGNVIEGNQIGSGAVGQTVFGNLGDGVHIEFSPGNTIGGTNGGAGNTIAFNMGSGVAIGDATGFAPGNAILGNSIFDNDQLGISSTPGTLTNGTSLISAFSVSPVPGTNDLQVSGTLMGTPNTSYRLECFANPAPDVSGFGQGQTFISYATVTTNGQGTSSFQIVSTAPVCARRIRKCHHDRSR